jgi:ATP-dependent helicase/nuclease subunit A
VTDDIAARERITTDLETNFLVEAGAGSGKTTALVGRLLALVRRGTPMEHLAAVTFTRKAATELRERFQEGLEKEHLTAALADIDRAFLGTIHAFCARLLREHPLEAGLDPGFEEIGEDEWSDVQQGFWSRWLERCRVIGDPALDELRRLGLDPRELLSGFQVVSRYPDVLFELAQVEAPRIEAAAQRLNGLMAKTSRLMPKHEPPSGWDKLQSVFRRLALLSRTGDWEDLPTFCNALTHLLGQDTCTVTQNRWSDDKEGKRAAKDLAAEWKAFVSEDVEPLLTRWREHRYTPVMRFLLRAADGFAVERRTTGRLGFEDLLLGAVRLLRDNSSARAELGNRYRHLLVDEFQDTDPIQAEVCFLLASDPLEGTDWRTVRPRPGSLFVVGDPKQSIYRFRRADILTYEIVRSRMKVCGDVLSLTRNFRSGEPVEKLVNSYFEAVFPAEAADGQAAFSPMVVDPLRAPNGDRVVRYAVRPLAKNKADIRHADSEALASRIAGALAEGQYKASDFLLLTRNKDGLGEYAKALSERNVPVAATGAKLPQELELRELVLLLRLLTDPGNSVLVAAVLEGVLFGLSPADLYDASLAGLAFTVAREPSTVSLLAGRSLEVIHRWWLLSRTAGADVLLERVLDDTGLLPFAASAPLGDNRAGSLLHIVSTVRGLDGGSSHLSGAIEAIERVLDHDTVDVSLRPGRADAVRLMNLHQAKGLEARVVCLIDPVDTGGHEPTSYVNRLESGQSVGGLLILGDAGILAQPVGWAEMSAREARFQAAEESRLLYVATTRAMSELWVAQLDFDLKDRKAEDRSAWSPLGRVLADQAVVVELEQSPAPGREKLAATDTELAEGIAGADRRRVAASAPSFLSRTVTRTAKAEREEEREYDLSVGRGKGKSWGRAVHRAIEALGKGRRGSSLEAYVSAVANDEGVGEATEELLDLVRRVEQSAEWSRLMASDQRWLELPVMGVGRNGEAIVVTEGVIDAAGVTDGRWDILDWKSDAVDDPTWRARLPAYTMQVEAYAKLIEDRLGAVAKGTIVRVV